MTNTLPRQYPMTGEEILEALAIAYANPSHFVETSPDGSVVMREAIAPFWLPAIAHLKITDGKVIELTLKDRLDAIGKLLEYFDANPDAAIAIPS